MGMELAGAGAGPGPGLYGVLCYLTAPAQASLPCPALPCPDLLSPLPLDKLGFRSRAYKPGLGHCTNEAALDLISRQNVWITPGIIQACKLLVCLSHHIKDTNVNKSCWVVFFCWNSKPHFNISRSTSYSLGCGRWTCLRSGVFLVNESSSWQSAASLPDPRAPPSYNARCRFGRGALAWPKGLSPALRAPLGPFASHQCRLSGLSGLARPGGAGRLGAGFNRSAC